MKSALKKVAMLMLCLVTAFSAQSVFAAVTFRNDQVWSAGSGNGGTWGGWYGPVYCPAGYWADGYAMRVEPPQGSGDDTALNAVKLYCRDRAGRNTTSALPHDGYWGQWREGAYCAPGAFMTHFRLKTEGYQYSGDDSAANSVGFWCSNGVGIEAAGGGSWGKWGPWQASQRGGRICGIKVRIESPQGSGDDTALNDVQIYWCKF